jgi:hypothetical protein
LPGYGEGKSVFFTIDQWQFIEAAIKKFKDEHDEPTLNDARVIEFIMAEYFAGG